MQRKIWFERLVEYFIIILILASLIYGVKNSSVNFGADEDSVAKKAIEYCKQNSTNMEMKEEPQHADAVLMTCNEVREKTTMSKCDGRSLDTKMWFVSTDGLWFLYGPADGNGGSFGPIQIDACYVLVDARIGEALEVRYSE